MPRQLLLPAALLVGVVLHAQVISGHILPGSEMPERLLLQEVHVGEFHILDSAQVDKRGRFVFPSRTYEPGAYRLEAATGDGLELVLDPREPLVELRIEGRPMALNTTVVRSSENQRLQEYDRAFRHAQQRLASLRQERTRAGDALSVASIAEREAAVQNDLEQLVARLVAQDTAGTFSRLMAAELRYRAAVAKGPEAMDAAVDWTSPLLLRSTLLPRALMGYLQALPDPGTRDFILAVDHLLARMAPVPGNWAAGRLFLLRIFALYGSDAVARHIVDTYVLGPGALVPPDEEVLAMAADILRAAPGTPSPDVELMHPGTDRSVRLSELLAGHSYTVLFFYSSSCEHCHAEMPSLRGTYAQYRQRGLQVLGVALDTDLQELLDTKADQGFEWPVFSELNGWGCGTAKAFGIRSTPSLVVLDEAGTIVSRPVDVRELGDMLGAALR